MKASKISYRRADEPSSVGVLWRAVIALVLFWAGFGFAVNALIARWLA